MNTKSTPVVIYVTYQGTSRDHFDRHYYVEVHLPLVMNAWSQYGLLSATAFYPAVEPGETIAICECVFRDEAGMKAAFGSAEAAEVMADVPHFTPITPSRLRVVAI